jgi:hypothetical protein
MSGQGGRDVKGDAGVLSVAVRPGTGGLLSDRFR